MKSLRFKGKTDTGEVVYGEGCYQSMGGQLYIVKNYQFIPVEAVAELLGYRDGRAIYSNEVKEQST